MRDTRTLGLGQLAKQRIALAVLEHRLCRSRLDQLGPYQLVPRGRTTCSRPAQSQSVTAVPGRLRDLLTHSTHGVRLEQLQEVSHRPQARIMTTPEM